MTKRWNSYESKKGKTPNPDKPLTAKEMSRMQWKRTDELPLEIRLDADLLAKLRPA